MQVFIWGHVQHVPSSSTLVEPLDPNDDDVVRRNVLGLISGSVCAMVYLGESDPP